MSTDKILTCKPILDSLSKIMDVTVIHCDTDIRHCEPWRGEDFLELKGGGGTRAVPAIQLCEHLNVDGMVYYTDGGFCDYGLSGYKKPLFDTIWLLVDTSRYGLDVNQRAKMTPL